MAGHAAARPFLLSETSVPAQSLPPVVSFRYRGRSVICTPYWTDAGELLDVRYPCPGCGQVAATMDVGVIPSSGQLTVLHPVTCLAGCGLVLRILRGVARDAVRLEDLPESRLQC